jgi:hypothetical protein
MLVALIQMQELHFLKNIEVVKVLISLDLLGIQPVFQLTRQDVEARHRDIKLLHQLLAYLHIRLMKLKIGL